MVFRKRSITVALLVALGDAVIAQQATNQPSRLAPVIVTASPATDPQATPASITTLSREELATAGAASVYDLPAFTPNLAISHSVARSFGDVYAVRGVANTQFFSDPSIAYYVDDAPASHVATFNTDLLAIDHVDIWRGPQGSVFGMNNEAGVIHIVSRKPTDRFTADASASYATFNTQLYRASVMGPLVPGQLRFALAGSYASTDGFMDNPVNNSHPDHQEGFDGRCYLGWTPTEDWDISFTVTGQLYDDGVRIQSLNAPYRQAPSDINPVADTDSNNEVLRICRTFQEFAITSVTTRQEFNLQPLVLDLDLSPLTGNTAHITQNDGQWTEELRAQSLSATADWHWLAGFFFSTSEQAGADTRNYFYGFPVTSQTRSTLGQDDYAVFGQATYAGIEKWAFTLGVRMDYSFQTLDRTVDSTLFAVPPVNDAKGFYNFAPKLTIGYQCLTNVLVYGSTGLGYKPGGFSAYINPPASPVFDTEQNWASEIGVKSAWLDNKLLANVTWFYSDIHNYQVERTLSNLVDLAIINAPRVISTGVELELVGRPLPGLELTGMLGYTSEWFNEFTDPETVQNLHGKHPPSVPEFNGLLAAQYQLQGGFFTRAEWAVVGRTFYTESNTRQFEQTGYGVLNARIGWQAKNFSIAVFGLNLTDTEYYTKKISDLNAGVPGQPRTIGVMATLSY